MAAYQCLHCKQIEHGFEDCCDSPDLFCINDMPGEILRLRAGQSRRHTLLEACTGTTIGAGGSWLITWAVMHWSPFELSVNVTIAVAACTVWSLARGYAVRRHFNRRQHDTP